MPILLPSPPPRHAPPGTDEKERTSGRGETGGQGGERGRREDTGRPRDPPHGPKFIAIIGRCIHTARTNTQRQLRLVNGVVTGAEPVVRGASFSAVYGGGASTRHSSERMERLLKVELDSMRPGGAGRVQEVVCVSWLT